MDVMLDIETLGKKPGCVILAIGAIAFDPLADTLPDRNNGGFVFYQNLSVLDQLLLGLTIDRETLDWWQTQSAAAVEALTTDKITLQGGLFRLVTWLGNLPGKTKGKIWAKSPDFDCAILEEAARLIGVNLPWDFRDKADVRTIGYVGDLCEAGAVPATKGTKHNALDDCYNQAAAVQHIATGLRYGKTRN